MLPVTFRLIPSRAFLPAGIVFILFPSVSLGLLATASLPFGVSAFTGFLAPLFAVIFIVMLSMVCAVFTLYQEPLFIRFPGLRGVALLGTLVLGVGLAVLLYHGGSYREVFVSLASANLVFFALLLGNFLVSGLNRSSELVPVCVVMSVADLLSVCSGPSKQMIEGIDVFYRDGRVGASPWSDFLLVKIAVPGIGHLVPVFGIADVVILAFLIAAAHKFQLDDNLLGCGLGAVTGWRSLVLRFPAAGAGLAVGLLAAHGFNMFLPALPVIAVFFLGYTVPRHPTMRLLRRIEWTVVCISLVFLSGWAVWG